MRVNCIFAAYPHILIPLFLNGRIGLRRGATRAAFKVLLMRMRVIIRLPFPLFIRQGKTKAINLGVWGRAPLFAFQPNAYWVSSHADPLFPQITMFYFHLILDFI